MIKAFVGRKAYYIFPKTDFKAFECLNEVAKITKNTKECFAVTEAKALDDVQYEIGAKGKFWAVTRK